MDCTCCTTSMLRERARRGGAGSGVLSARLRSCTSCCCRRDRSTLSVSVSPSLDGTIHKLRGLLVVRDAARITIIPQCVGVSPGRNVMQLSAVAGHPGQAAGGQRGQLRQRRLVRLQAVPQRVQLGLALLQSPVRELQTLL